MTILISRLLYTGGERKEKTRVAGHPGWTGVKRNLV
jgi:hypothetical protein